MAGTVLAVLGPDGPQLADPAAPLLRADDLVAPAVRAYGESDGVLRLVCTGGGVVFALLGPVPAETVRGREQGVRAVTLTLGVAADVRAHAPRCAAAGWPGHRPPRRVARPRTAVDKRARAVLGWCHTGEEVVRHFVCSSDA